jgi:hypothetical protein
MHIYNVFIIAVELVTILSCCAFSADFGKNIKVKTDYKNSFIIADFNGDKHMDTLVLLEIEKNAVPKNDCRIFDPWYGQKIKSGGEPLALGFILSNNVSRTSTLTIVHDSAFFSTPIWTSINLPIELLTKKTPQFKQWENDVPELKMDGIILGTEAGIDILLYWNGKELNLYQPTEEP